MGSVVSGAEHNDDLVDILRFLGYIETKTIERVFRAVDRGDYVLAAHREGAYKDLSWKIGNIHLSAPCVYGKVMEGLSLEPGLSFLNLGSGTGYLSTMAGLILNHHGTNHGIELNEDCLEYAYTKLDEFKQKSLALDEFDFCEPVFMHGNCLKLEANRQYDRVYCGAACPESHEAFIKQFVKVGGILVMPYKENLLRIERIDEDIWRHKAMLPVSFAPLMIPKDDDQRSLQLPHSEPLSLQELCRCIIRCELRKLLWESHPEIQSRDLITTRTINAKNQPSALPQHLTENDAFGTRSSSGDDEDPSQAQLFFYVDENLKEAGLVSQSQTVRGIVISRTNECSLDACDNIDGETAKQLSKAKNCIGIDTPQSMTVSDSPSTSYQNNVTSDILCDNNKKSPHTVETINTEVINHQGSTVNSVEKTNEIFQCYSDDDAMDLDIPIEQWEQNPNIELKNEINTPWFNDIGVYEEEANQSHREMVDDNIGERSRKSLKRNAPMSDSSNNISSSSSDSTSGNSNSRSSGSHSDSRSSSSDDDEDSSDDPGTSMYLFKLHQRCQKEWGLPTYKCDSEDYPNNHSGRSEMNGANDPDMTYLPKYTPHQVYAHNVDINIFSVHMRDKISKLPLPTSLLTYINYNRTL